jgi:enoyl-CoA hydratase/carnithine racemase
MYHALSGEGFDGRKAAVCKFVNKQRAARALGSAIKEIAKAFLTNNPLPLNAINNVTRHAAQTSAGQATARCSASPAIPHSPRTAWKRCEPTASF